MATVRADRVSAEIEGDFVVFLIGIRVNKPWKIHQWLPAFMAMPRMIKELVANPELGCLGTTFGYPVMVQYWRSFDHLEAYAKARDKQHLPAWSAFNRRVGRSRGDVGIWHETYKVRDGEYENIYSGMPKFGLGKCGNLMPSVDRRTSARGRISPVEVEVEVEVG